MDNSVIKYTYIIPFYVKVYVSLFSKPVSLPALEKRKGRKRIRIADNAKKNK